MMTRNKHIGIGLLLFGFLIIGVGVYLMDASTGTVVGIEGEEETEVVDRDTNNRGKSLLVGGCGLIVIGIGFLITDDKERQP